MIAVREGYSSYFDRNPINPPPLISFPSPPGEPLHEGDAEARRTPLLREYALTTLESILLSLDGRTVKSDYKITNGMERVFPDFDNFLWYNLSNS